MDITIPQTLEQWNGAGQEYLPGHLGMTFVKVEPDEVIATMAVRKALAAWNGFLHAGAVVWLADFVLWLRYISQPADRCGGLHHGRIEKQFSRYGAPGLDRLHGAAAASGSHDAGVGCERDAGRRSQAHRSLPLHANDLVAE